MRKPRLKVLRHRQPSGADYRGPSDPDSFYGKHYRYPGAAAGAAGKLSEHEAEYDGFRP